MQNYSVLQTVKAKLALKAKVLSYGAWTSPVPTLLVRHRL